MSTTDLTIEEKVALAGLLRTDAMFLDVATNDTPLQLKSERFARLLSIAEKCGIVATPVFDGIMRAEFTVPGYTPPPTKRAADLEPGDVIVIHRVAFPVAEVKQTSGGITKVNGRSFFSNDLVEIRPEVEADA